MGVAEANFRPPVILDTRLASFVKASILFYQA